MKKRKLSVKKRGLPPKTAIVIPTLPDRTNRVWLTTKDLRTGASDATGVEPVGNGGIRVSCRAGSLTFLYDEWLKVYDAVQHVHRFRA